MDIQVSSNFERLLFDLYSRDGAAVARAMASLAQSGAFEIDPARLETARAVFDATSADDDETLATMSRIFKDTGALIDPHTAVGVASLASSRRDPAMPMVVLSTAHPAKFPDAVVKATGEHPSLPPRLSDLMTREEKFTQLPNDQGQIQAFIRDHTRAATN